MRYQLYTKSKSAWEAMLKEIETAQKCIYMEMYIFLNDTNRRHDFIGKLKKKAENGVKVVIVADAYGSKPLQKESESLKKSGVDILFFSNWLRHIHRKILIVDDKTAFIGGVNIGKRFSEWNDLQLKLSGRIVKRLIKSFSYTYEMAGGKDNRILSFRESKFTYKLKYWIFDHFPARNIHTLRRSYEKKISSAKKSIQIITPYFVPPRWMISLLDSAVRRGVSIEILLPEKSDSLFTDRVNLRYIKKLSNLGIKFHLTKNMNHSKLLLIDSKEGILGSQNIDPFSFLINSEAGVFFQDRNLIKELNETIMKWKSSSKKFDLKSYKKRPMDYLVSLLTKVFYPVL